MFGLGKLNYFFFRRKWRKKNKHNGTYAVSVFEDSCVDVGNYTYGGINAFIFNKRNKLKIGNMCSIGPEVAFILSADHYIDHISSFPYRVKILGEALEGVSKGDIIIEDDVWIGYDATILSGVTIGQGAIVAARAVVTKNVPPYAIVAGVPAKVIRYRFSQSIIDKLIKIDYSQLDDENIWRHIEDLYETVDENTDLSWLPKKNK